MSEPSFTAAAWSELAACISRWTGFHPDAVWSRAVRDAVRPLLERGLSPAEVIARAQQDDPAVRQPVTQAVPVGESYFFRIPEHFDHVARVLAPRWAREPGRVRRIWSAGCAAGEEAYSLAAVLRASGLVAFQVVGTDLVEANVASARAGRFGRWSLRGAHAPEGTFLPAGPDGIREVDPALRSCARFEAHNLLDPPPAPAQFDLIFCRNVLIYFTRSAAERALASLVAALAPDGVIAFAAMDVPEAPAGLERVGAPELQLFRRASPEVRALRPHRDGARAPAAPTRTPASGPARRTLTPRRPRTARAAPAESAPAAEPVSLHLRALAQIERGDHAAARALLGELQEVAPGYLPGMLEGALLHAREGRRGNAVALMRSILLRATELPGEQPVAGPETLPASFYAAAARRFLGAEVRR